MQLRDLFDEFPVAKGEAVPLVLQQLLATSLNVNEDWAEPSSCCSIPGN